MRRVFLRTHRTRLPATSSAGGQAGPLAAAAAKTPVGGRSRPVRPWRATPLRLSNYAGAKKGDRHLARGRATSQSPPRRIRSALFLHLKHPALRAGGGTDLRQRVCGVLGSQTRRCAEKNWIPAFAGMTGKPRRSLSQTAFPASRAESRGPPCQGSRRTGRRRDYERGLGVRSTGFSRNSPGHPARLGPGEEPGFRLSPE